MSAPLPLTVNTPPLADALPAATTLPMSACDQPVGSWDDVAVRTANSPDFAAPMVSPPAFCARIWMRPRSVTGGLFHWHDVALPGRLAHSAMAEVVKPSSGEKRKSNR